MSCPFDETFQELPAALDANEREFLRTLVHAKPKWSLLGIPHLEEHRRFGGGFRTCSNCSETTRYDGAHCVMRSIRDCKTCHERGRSRQVNLAQDVAMFAANRSARLQK